ncbi:hypothetical protein [Streptomyces sp. NRRL B-24720]|uniref:hypothetical protein n=1 Tax=Streptomyces sp. NRRL B-24720 TaxID=1476876 RepID=UPI0004CBFE9A|nr:hypothetical protein [Streptomyces sp. NRRL B-24720]
MQSTAPCPPARRSITRARLFDAPLDDLLLELNVELHWSSVTDAEFKGLVVQREDGSLVLSLPPGRPPRERDTMAQALLGQALQASRTAGDPAASLGRRLPAD